MIIKFNVTQEDIEKAGSYMNTRNCLGCTVLKRVLGVNYIGMGGQEFHIIRDSFSDIEIGSKFSDYLQKTICRKVNPERHSIDIPDSVLEQIGYFDRKGDTTVESYITSKENNIEDRKLPKETKHQRNPMVEKESY